MRCVKLKKYVICFVLICFLFSSCANVSTPPQANREDIIIMHGDGSGDMEKQIKDYYNYVIETIKSKNFASSDKNYDNLEGLTYALSQCTDFKGEFFSRMEITPVAQNPDNGLYVAEFDTDGWRVNLLLISFENGEITYIKEIGKEANRDCTSEVRLNGFDEMLIQTFVATNRGNGDMKLITFDREAQVVGEFKCVVDFSQEYTVDPFLNKEYNLDEWNGGTSYVYGNVDDRNHGILFPIYKDINNDGYDDVQFVGIQTLIDYDANTLDQFDVSLIYHYNPQEKVFELIISDSILPNRWDGI